MKVTTERRQLMIEYICQVRFTTRVILMREFNISKNTVDRDLEILMCSYPIETYQGKGGGVRIAEGFRLGMKYLNDTQCALLEKLSETLSGDELLTMQSILKTFSKPIK